MCDADPFRYDDDDDDNESGRQTPVRYAVFRNMRA